MKISVNRDLCVGHGVCESIASDLFAVGDDAISQVLVDEIPADRREAAEEAVASCPAHALRSTE